MAAAVLGQAEVPEDLSGGQPISGGRSGGGSLKDQRG